MISANVWMIRITRKFFGLTWFIFYVRKQNRVPYLVTFLYRCFYLLHTYILLKLHRTSDFFSGNLQPLLFGILCYKRCSRHVTSVNLPSDNHTTCSYISFGKDGNSNSSFRKWIIHVTLFSRGDGRSVRCCPAANYRRLSPPDTCSTSLRLSKWCLCILLA